MGAEQMITGVLFDKDGTLFDFRATWAGWTAALLREAARGDDAYAIRLGAAIGFDLPTMTFAPHSPVIGDTPDGIADMLLPLMPGTDKAGLVAHMVHSAASNPMSEAVPLAPLLGGLRERGLKIGLATNDGEAPARAHLASVGVVELFDSISGFDSGHGGKPGPGMLLAFAREFGLDPATVAMVGDSRHDLEAGRRAGMRTVAVLTGIAEAPELAPHADVVLPDIGHLPGWIASFEVMV